MRIEVLQGAEIASAHITLDAEGRNDGGGLPSWAAAKTDRPFVGGERGPAAAAAAEVGGIVVIGWTVHTGGRRKPRNVALARHIAVVEVDVAEFYVVVDYL